MSPLTDSSAHAGPADAIQPTLSGMLPLAVGQRWSWSIEERIGAGPRFLFMPTEPAEQSVISRWSFEVVGRSEGEYQAVLVRTPVDGMPASSQIKLWLHGDEWLMDAGNGTRTAIEAVLPPTAISSERIPCVAHYLGGVAGLCSPIPGGPLEAMPGMGNGIVSQQADNGATMAQFLVGISTAGLFIPGNRKSTVYAHLSDFDTTGAQLRQVDSPLWKAWSQGPAPRSESSAVSQLTRLIGQHGADAEGLGAITASLPEGFAASVALAGLSQLPSDQRPPVLRVALQSVDAGLGRLGVLAKGRYSLEAVDEATRASLVAKFDAEDERRQAERLLTDPCPALGEAFAQARDLWDDDWVAAVDTALQRHPVDDVSVMGMLQQPKFDDGRVEVLALIVTAAPEDDRPRYVAMGMDSVSFDSGKLELLKAHEALLLALPAAERRALTDKMTFDDAKAEARALLGL